MGRREDEAKQRAGAPRVCPFDHPGPGRVRFAQHSARDPMPRCTVSLANDRSALSSLRLSLSRPPLHFLFMSSALNTLSCRMVDSRNTKYSFTVCQPDDAEADTVQSQHPPSPWCRPVHSADSIHSPHLVFRASSAYPTTRRSVSQQGDLNLPIPVRPKHLQTRDVLGDWTKRLTRNPTIRPIILLGSNHSVRPP